MTRVIFNTATSFDGYIADPHNSLDWLFAVEPPPTGEHEAFLSTIGVLVEGSTTYNWVLDQEELLTHPEKWQRYYGDRPTFVFTTRAVDIPDSADVRVVAGSVRSAWEQIRAAAGDGDVWVVGGGDLAGQFLDAGLLDEVRLSVAPVALSAGAPVFPRIVGSDRLRLRSVEKSGQFATLVYDVSPPGNPLD